MLTDIKTFFSKHFSGHIILYFTVILFFGIGIASGVFSVRVLSEIQRSKLMDYLVSSMRFIFIEDNTNSLEIFLYSALNNIKIVFIIWLLAISLISFPLILVVIGIRGFALGFTIGFLIENMGYKGILFSTVSILPQNLIFIPILIFLGVFSISYSISTLRERKTSKYTKNDTTYNFIKYSIACLVICGLLMIGSLVEGYISPIFLKGISQYIVN